MKDYIFYNIKKMCFPEFNWLNFKSCIMCRRWTFNTTNVCSKCHMMLYDYSFNNKTSFSDFGEYGKLR